MNAHTIVTATSAADMASTVPFLLGFHPEESAVILGTTRETETRRSVVGALRFDLPGLVDDPSIVPHSVKRFWAHVTEVLIVCYSEDRDQADATVAALVNAVDGAGLSVGTHAVVCGGRVFAPDQPEGCPGVDALTPSAAATALAVTGRAPLPSRESVFATFDPRDVEPMAEALQVAREASAHGPRRAALTGPGVDAWRTLLDGAQQDSEPRNQPRMTDTALAAAVLLLEDPAFRDALVVRAVGVRLPEALPGTDTYCAALPAWNADDDSPLAALADRLAQMAHRIPNSDAGLWLGVCALLLWACGDSVRALAAADRGVQCKPCSTYASLVRLALMNGVAFSDIH